jgi:kinetochore protein Spc24, fungi type
VPSAEQHAENLNRLYATRLSLAKALNDAEGAVASKQAELTRLKEELRQLEESDPAAEHELDGSAWASQLACSFSLLISADADD